MATHCLETTAMVPMARQSTAGIRRGAVQLTRGRQLHGSNSSSLKNCVRASTCGSSGIRIERQFSKGTGISFGTHHFKLTSFTRCRRRLRQYDGQAARRVRTTAVFEMFTERAIKSVMLAQKEARAMKCREVGVVHLLLGLIGEDINSTIFGSGSRSLEMARRIGEEVCKPGYSGSYGGEREIPFSLGAKQAFDQAMKESHQMNQNYISPEHVILALTRIEDQGAVIVLERLGLRTQTVQEEAKRRIRLDFVDMEESKPSSPEKAEPSVPPSQSTPNKKSEGKDSALKEFCIDLTTKAKDGLIDPVVGRDAEILRVSQILARRKKNNPILLGEPGVGKTAIAEGLARKIAAQKCPSFLKGKRVLQLDIGLLMAGAKERGELELRVTNLLEEARNSNIIFVIDEIHVLVGAGNVNRGGSGGGGLDIANMFKPALARGELQCIGATTLDEHRKYIEKDVALARRFQPVNVAEPNEEDALVILKGLRDRYERYHKCEITDDALEAAVKLSKKYIADRFLPDKAIDLVDEACSRARIAAHKKRRERVMQSSGKNDDVASVSNNGIDERSADLWNELKQIQKRKSGRPPTLFGSQQKTVSPASSFLSEESVVVNEEEIANVCSAWTKIPMERMTQDEMASLTNLSSTLKEMIIGQDDAVVAISRSLQRSRVGFGSPSRPIGSFLFCGPTGVGKTELTKCLAEELFDSKDAMIRLDMSEMQERHSVSKLIGSPPGYVGFNDGGQLTEKVRRNPYSIILFDEIEKAHPDVFNILLQVLEDGRLTDSTGRTVNFKNSLIVMTSNIGSHVISKGVTGLGFDTKSHEGAEGEYKQMKSLVVDELRNYFRPELLNRLDDIIVFRKLQKQDVHKIAERMLKETADRMMAEKGIGLIVTKRMMDFIEKDGFDQDYGARPLRRAITRHIEDTLCEYVLNDEVQTGETILIDQIESGEITVTSFKASPQRGDTVDSTVKASTYIN